MAPKIIKYKKADLRKGIMSMPVIAKKINASGNDNSHKIIVNNTHEEIPHNTSLKSKSNPAGSEIRLIILFFRLYNSLRSVLKYQIITPAQTIK